MITIKKSSDALSNEILEMNKIDFYNFLIDDNFPEAESGDEFSSLIILPSPNIHDSGYSEMSFILLGNKNEPAYKITRGCDVLMQLSDSYDWHIDCLPCGLLRFFYVFTWGEVVVSHREGVRIKQGKRSKFEDN